MSSHDSVAGRERCVREYPTVLAVLFDNLVHHKARTAIVPSAPETYATGSRDPFTAAPTRVPGVDGLRACPKNRRVRFDSEGAHREHRGLLHAARSPSGALAHRACELVNIPGNTDRRRYRARPPSAPRYHPSAIGCFRLCVFAHRGCRMKPPGYELGMRGSTPRMGAYLSLQDTTGPWSIGRTPVWLAGEEGSIPSGSILQTSTHFFVLH